MITKKHFPILFFLLVAGNFLHAQVTVASASLIPFNVTPASLCQVTLMNTQAIANVELDAAVYNSAGEVLLEVKTAPFRITGGINVIQGQSLAFVSTVYAASPQGKFVQAQHQLPSGAFKHCVRVINLDGELGDEFCQDIESDNNSFLNLVSPFDRDTIDTKTPLLIWTHSEAFNLLSQGESFRLVLVKSNDGQDAEAAVTANPPYFIYNNLFRHDLQYSFDAPVLVEGQTYAWQVQKLSAGGQTVVNKTESWQFTVRKPKVVSDNKYSVLKTQPDAGYYTAYNNRIFFRFDEPYAGTKISCIIYDEKRKRIDPQPEKDSEQQSSQQTLEAKTSGYNGYEIDLDSLHLKSGYYFLEVLNEKKEKFILKFYVE